jgi:hypothetical protein
MKGNIKLIQKKCPTLVLCGRRTRGPIKQPSKAASIDEIIMGAVFGPHWVGELVYGYDGYAATLAGSRGVITGGTLLTAVPKTYFSRFSLA